MKKLTFFNTNFQTSSKILAYDKILESSQPWSSITVKRFGKTITDFDYFRKILHLKSLAGLCLYFGFQICQGSEYSTIVNVPGF